MPSVLWTGRLLLALGTACLGGLGLAYGDFLLEWTNIPGTLPARTALAYANGVIMLAAGVALLFDRTVRVAALALAALWFIYALRHIPTVIENWRGGVGVEAETIALASMALLLAGASDGPRGELLAKIGRYGFGLCMPFFGVVHFLYPDGVATWIPSWIPGSGVFWAYATGVAHVAAGLAVLSGVLATLGARLNALMYLSWLVILHIPRVIATPQDRHEWTTLFVACAINGGALILAGYLARRATQKAAPAPA
jgi:uncharacterized membrane protein